MVFLFRRAIPVIRTVFSDLQPLVFILAVKFTAGTRQTESIRFVTNGTIPGMFAFRIRIARFPAFETVPIIVQARTLRRVMRINAPRTRPIMVAAVILQQDIFAR